MRTRVLTAFDLRKFFGSLLLCLSILGANSFSVERRQVPGIWKLSSDSLPYEQDLRSILKGLLPDETPHEILLKLNPDGTFKQCNEGYQEGRWMNGRWELTDGSRVVLVMRRQYYGPRYDVVLEGKVSNQTQGLNLQGEIQKGKFMYSQRHPAFFDQPLANGEALGSFRLEQSVSTNAILPKAESDDSNDDSTATDAGPTFQTSDFFDRNFVLTIEPLPSRADSEDLLNVPVDLRAMPITFHANSTFQAIGTNKILRGRFQVSEQNQLSFDVSLFGAGRSMPGSVYSEGIGLVHDDKRSYRGSIDASQGRLFVEGFVTFGTDMGSDARPEPVGVFLLTEVADETTNARRQQVSEDDIPSGGIFE